MESYKLEQVSSRKMTSKSGKEFLSVGIKVNGEWYNGFGKPGVTDKWGEGMEVTGIELYEKDGYKNFRILSVFDRMDALEKRVEALEKNSVTF